ncbi:replication protein RepA4 [Salmonella enterica]|nr:replication protein RepA4 [Salmonella enterica]EDS2539712.1 replication protein RepA4 [Salmonella enterica]
MSELLCAVGVVPTRVYPQSGRISALAGREGRLRACTEDFQPEDWQR